MKKEILIDGSKIVDKTSLYTELNNKLMPNENWKLGESLDAFNDLLYGGFGEINGNEPIRLIWKDFLRMKELFGHDFTLNFYHEKLKYPNSYNKNLIKNSIKELNAGTGKTYFEIILEIIADHPNIELVEE
ncbi:ribonuclease inhibitor [Soonwooa sp.]|uniref:barstar family protein n=1 Tax=Soonwooa sp. TaxID=1938592 RepID=UPI00289CAB20|nr:ribonuclease inhibitor [Soonwooa sp.]